MKAPIVIFAYNRPWHTEQMFLSLEANLYANESDVIVYIDGPKTNASNEQFKNIEEVKSIVKRQKWCKSLTIKAAEYNQGLAQSIIKGVTDTLTVYDKIIVLEDDLILSPYFLKFMNDGLEKYERNEEVISIHGYCVPINHTAPVFFMRGADCWGWATWRRGWALFNPDSNQLLQQLKFQKLLYDFDLEGTIDYSGMLQKQIDGRVDSWAIRWYASAFLHKKLTLYPTYSYVLNSGGDDSGTHPQDQEMAKTKLNENKVELPDIPIEETVTAREMIIQHYYKHLSLRGKIKKWLKWGYRI